MGLAPSLPMRAKLVLSGCDLRWVYGKGGWWSGGGCGSCGSGSGVVRREGELEEDEDESPLASPERRLVSIDRSTAIARAAMAVCTL